MKNMILGISSRNYAESVESFVKVTHKEIQRKQAFCEGYGRTDEGVHGKDLAGLTWLRYYHRRHKIQGHLIVVALGLDKAARSMFWSVAGGHGERHYMHEPP